MNLKKNLIKNKIAIIALLATITTIFGIIGFYIEDKNFYETIMGIFDLFVFESIDEYNGFIVMGRIFALFTVFFGVLLFFINRFSNYLVVYSALNRPYTLVVGLGRNNRYYLDSEIDSQNIIVVEKDKENPYIDSYIAKGFGVIIEDISDREILDRLQLNNIQKVIISIGSDRKNIEILIKMIEYLDEYRDKRFYIYLNDFLLNPLFTEEIIEYKNSEIVSFSFYELATQKLLMQHSILGDKIDIVKRDEPFFVAIIGSGDLALHLIYQLCNIAHLPNENKLIIYCIDKEIDKFMTRIENSFININKIPNIELKGIKKDTTDIDFYQQKLWYEENLTNIFITKTNEEENLTIALDFYNRCYIKSISQNQLKTKIIFASYRYSKLSQHINQNQKKFKQFYTFADASEIFTKENLLNEELNSIAKIINYGYGDIYEPNMLRKIDKSVDNKWFQKASLNDKISNKMQGLHIDVKLLSLGLKKIKSDKSSKELLKLNQKIFREKLGEINISDQELIEYSKELSKAHSGVEFDILYFPKKFNSLFEKLVRSEHNRWNACHYLNGWSYNPIKNKAYKEHDCLLPLSDFNNPNIQLTVIYDIYAVLYIPNILASVGYEIIEL